jgi:hypothetical protein
MPESTLWIPGADERIRLRRIAKKWGVKLWTGYEWLRTGSSGGHVWTRWQWTLGLRKRRRISWVAEQVSASEERFWYMEVDLPVFVLRNELRTSRSTFDFVRKCKLNKTWYLCCFLVVQNGEGALEPSCFQNGTVYFLSSGAVSTRLEWKYSYI